MSSSFPVRCLVCGELLIYNKDRTQPLMEHLRTKHPYIQIAKLAYPSTYRANASFITAASGDQDKSLLYVNKEILKKDGKPNTKDFTSKIVTGKLYCPTCDCECEPVIKKPKNPLTSSALGAFFMLGCWPFCFLPFFMWGTRIVSLYCPKCSQILGTYDRKLNIMIKRPSAENSQDCQKIKPKVSSSTSAPNLNYNK